MTALKCCKLNLLQWRLHPKYILCLTFLVLNMWQLLHGFIPYAQAVGDTLSPWILPLLPGHSSSYAFTMLAFVLLISDAPFRNAQQRFIIQRTGKLQWVLGQILYLFVLSVVFTLVLFVISWAVLLPVLEWQTDWGVVIETACRYPDAYATAGLFPPVTCSLDIMLGCTGLEATLWTMAIQILVCFFLGLLVLSCNLYTNRSVGTALATAFVFLSFFVRSVSSQAEYFRYLSWVSPLSWPDRSLMGFTNMYLPPYSYGVYMPLILCTVLIVLVVTTIHRKDVDGSEN